MMKALSLRELRCLSDVEKRSKLNVVLVFSWVKVIVTLIQKSTKNRHFDSDASKMITTLQGSLGYTIINLLNS